MNCVERIPTLCLNMIVKNESNIITRLFDSVFPIIDSYCICDTGSTDNTIQIIEDYFKSKNVPGKVIQEPFKDFCHNRTFSLQSCVGMSDYVLLLDADMVLDIKHFDKSTLKKADFFMLSQGNDSFYYQNTRIVKNNGLFSYVGVTHEYINVPPNSIAMSIDKQDMFIKDIGDGGCKSNKFERDVALLTQGIKDEPTNARYHFYLANSYNDLQQYENAIEMYKKRIEFGGWKEEVWYSYYKLALCYMKLDKMPEMLWYLMEGYQFYPERLEGLYEIINYYRWRSKYKVAFSIYNMCREYLDKTRNRDGYLFLHNDVYKYKLYYEYSLIAAYNGVTNINDEIVECLNHATDDGNISNLFMNMKFYKHVLTQKDRRVFDDTFEKYVNDVVHKFNSSSSCLIKHPFQDGYMLNVRYVNYTVTDKGDYLYDRYVLNINKCIDLDEHFNVVKEEFMPFEFCDRRYVGVEDVRLFYNEHTRTLNYIGTGYHSNNTLGVSTGEYNQEQNHNITELQTNFSNAYCEKNWVYVDYKNDNHLIYKWYPLTICKRDDDIISIVEEKQMPKIFSRMRGSSCGFKYENECWFVTHLVSYESPRHYYHMICVFDQDMNLLRYSAPFKFEGICIEFCLSIVVNKEEVMMNYSTLDRTTRIGIYDKQYIESILKYN